MNWVGVLTSTGGLQDGTKTPGDGSGGGGGGLEKSAPSIPKLHITYWWWKRVMSMQR
jgi:hypothetical protein